jgi:hypothetical protein
MRAFWSIVVMFVTIQHSISSHAPFVVDPQAERGSGAD